MFFQILNIIAPVFILVAAGYFAVRRGLMNDSAVDGVMKFAIQFAVPCLLFRAAANLDLNAAYDPGLMLSFYVAANCCFFLGYFIARRFFNRRPGEAVAVGFSGLFSNLLLMGLPISERAYGLEAMAPSYAIVSVHAPFCYLLGITTMEWLRADGRSAVETAQVVAKSMFRNSLMIGLGLGFLVNLGNIAVPATLDASIELLSRAALPAALFGLGGVLTRYQLKSAFGEASAISGLSLVLHPTLCFALCWWLSVPEMVTKTVVLMAAMAPGLNGYLFANMYQRGQETAASTVLIGTVASVFSISVWLWILGL